jgi:hypothetical protein
VVISFFLNCTWCFFENSTTFALFILKDNIMVYVAINEKKAQGQALLQYLKRIDERRVYVNFMDEEDGLDLAINDAMKTPRVKSGNSLREILVNNGA